MVLNPVTLCVNFLWLLQQITTNQVAKQLEITFLQVLEARIQDRSGSRAELPRVGREEVLLCSVHLLGAPGVPWLVVTGLQSSLLLRMASSSLPVSLLCISYKDACP